MTPPSITRLPAVVRGLPRVGSGPAMLLDPTAFFTRSRKRHGDTFGFRRLCLFSPESVQSLYSPEEKHTSFGLAT
jgi:hypothetical protein